MKNKPCFYQLNYGAHPKTLATLGFWCYIFLPLAWVALPICSVVGLCQWLVEFRLNGVRIFSSQLLRVGLKSLRYLYHSSSRWHVQSISQFYEIFFLPLLDNHTIDPSTICTTLIGPLSGKQDNAIRGLNISALRFLPIAVFWSTALCRRALKRVHQECFTSNDKTVIQP